MSKIAKISVIFGCISIAAFFLIVIEFIPLITRLLIGIRLPPEIHVLPENIIGGALVLIYYFGGWIFPSIGFILGIIGFFKPSAKKISLLGIGLSIIGLIGYIYIFWLLMPR